MKLDAKHLAGCILSIVLSITSLFPRTGFSQSEPGTPDLLDMSLEQLLDIQVTSVSKKPQKLSEVAAAVYVISNADIRRSGATSIPDALRLAPGVEVGRIDANKWAVSIRGFNGRFANKLLVLIDGRSVYTPLFAGVFWDAQDLPIEDIDRIEVIRGPGATLWGANAVNGVINIITKSTAETLGTSLNVIGGNEEQIVTLRHGGQVSDEANFRVYAKYINRDGSVLANSGNNSPDDFELAHFGFRFDWDHRTNNKFVLQGDVYSGDTGTINRVPIPTAPFSEIRNDEGDIEGGNVLARWTHQFSSEQELTVQAYYDRTERKAFILDETRDTFDAEFQHRVVLGERHDLIWGLGYRYTEDETRSTVFTSFFPAKRDDDLFSAFIQDEIVIFPDRLHIVLGTKFEKNDYTGNEWQPNARILFTPADNHTFWGSVARAVRTPTRIEHDGRIHAANFAPGTAANPFPVPAQLFITGNRTQDSEVLVAYEIGYRSQISDEFNLDMSFFYNDYRSLSTVSIGTPECSVSGTSILVFPPCFLFEPSINLNINTGAMFEAETYGFEFSSRFRISPTLRVKTQYSYLDFNFPTTSGLLNISDEPGQNARHKVNLFSAWDIRPNLEFNLLLRYTDKLTGFNINDYFGLDAQIRWRPVENLELSLVGKDLLETSHAEFNSEGGDIIPIEIQRSAYIQLRWNF